MGCNREGGLSGDIVRYPGNDLAEERRGTGEDRSVSDAGCPMDRDRCGGGGGGGGGGVGSCLPRCSTTIGRCR